MTSSRHDFRLLWVAQTASELGTHVSSFAFPLLTLALTGSPLLAGLVEAAYLLGLVGALLPAGVLADRVDRRRLMRTSSGAGAVLFSSLVLAAALGTLTLPHLVVVALLSGVAAGLFSPAETSAVRAVVRRDELTSALAQNQARQHVASLVGGPLGALLWGLSRTLPFAADAASYAVSWLLLGRLRTDLSAVDGPRRSPTTDLREGIGWVWRHPLLRMLTAWSFLGNLSMNALFTVAVLRMAQDGVDPLHIGLVSSAAGVSGIVGAVLASRVVERVPTGWLTIAVAWSPLPLVVPMALWPDPVVVAAALGTTLLLNPIGNTGMGSYRLTVTPAALVGRVQAATQVVGMASLPLAPLLAGGLLAGLGGTTAVLAAGVLSGVVALVPTLSRSVRAVPRPRQWPTPPAGEAVSVAPDMMEACPKETASASSRASSTGA